MYEKQYKQKNKQQRKALLLAPVEPVLCDMKTELPSGLVLYHTVQVYPGTVL